jgi:CBS domain-containing protein
VELEKRAWDVMTPNVACVGEEETVAAAAERMAALEVGALPICDGQGRVRGMLTDRDIVVKVLAQGGDPHRTPAGELSDGELVAVEPDAPLGLALRRMAEHKVRRLPVVERRRVVGMVSQADIATRCPEYGAARLVQEISAAPADRRAGGWAFRRPHRAG